MYVFVTEQQHLHSIYKHFVFGIITNEFSTHFIGAINDLPAIFTNVSSGTRV